MILRPFFRYLALNHYNLLNGIIGLLRKTLYASSDDPIRKILIIRKGSIGDTVAALPILNAIRDQYPSAAMHLLTHDFGRRAIAANQIIPETLISHYYFYDEHPVWELYHKIKSGNYDLVIELPQYLDTIFTQLRNMLFLRLCGIQAGIGWEVGSTLFLKKYQLRYKSFRQETSRLFERLKEDGLEISMNGQYELRLQPVTDQLPERYAVLAPGAKHKRKQWPLEYFIKIAERLKRVGIETIWIGDAADAKRLEKYDVGFNYCGKWGVAQSAFVIQKALLALTNDSGPMHLSYAVNTPVVALFSARDYPGKWFPPETKKAVVLRHMDVACALCVNKECGENCCMKMITEEMVYQAIQQIIANA